MCDSQCQHNQTVFLDFANDSVVTDAIPPETGQISAQRLTKMSRVLASRDPVIKPVNEPFLYGTIEFPK
jgi:hypothetical protein